jgi:hypothetical protein
MRTWSSSKTFLKKHSRNNNSVRLRWTFVWKVALRLYLASQTRTLFVCASLSSHFAEPKSYSKVFRLIADQVVFLVIYAISSFPNIFRHHDLEGDIHSKY